MAKGKKSKAAIGESSVQDAEKNAVVGEIVGAVIDHKEKESATEKETATVTVATADGELAEIPNPAATTTAPNSVPSTATPTTMAPKISKDLADARALTPSEINLLRDLPAADVEFFNRGVLSFGEGKWVDDCPFLADEHKAEIWLLGFSQGVITEGWMAAKYGKPVESCPYVELVDQSPEHQESCKDSAENFDVAATWRRGFNAYHGIVPANELPPLPESSTVEPTDQDAVILKLADGTESTGETPATDSTKEIPKPSKNGTEKPHYDAGQYLRDIQSQNREVQRALAEAEAARLVYKEKKAAHESEHDKLSKLISDQEAAETAWNRPLPLFDATQVFKPNGESNAATSEGPAPTSVTGETVVIEEKKIDPAKTGPLSDEQVANAWRYASIGELNLPGKLTDKLKDDAGVSTIGELEDLRATPKGLGGIKGIGAAKITIIEDAVIAWLSIQRDAKALAEAANDFYGPDHSKSVAEPPLMIDLNGRPADLDAVADSMADVTTVTVGGPALAAVDVASFVPGVSFDDI